MTKINFPQNRVKGPQRPIKYQKVTCSPTICKKNDNQQRKISHYQLSKQNSVKFCTDFTRARTKFTQSLFTPSYIFAYLSVRQTNPMVSTKAILISDGKTNPLVLVENIPAGVGIT